MKSSEKTIKKTLQRKKKLSKEWGWNLVEKKTMKGEIEKNQIKKYLIFYK